jgi:hypothetical protein
MVMRRAMGVVPVMRGRRMGGVPSAKGRRSAAALAAVTHRTCNQQMNGIKLRVKNK